MPDEFKIGSPILLVKDLEQMLAFYDRVFGLKRNRKKRGEEIDLGFNRKNGDSGNPLLVLKQDQKATEPPHNSAGLFHFAILVPDRKSLAQAYLAIRETKRAKFEGFGDHLVSESMYLHDPERNGIEIYRDRPRNEWRHDEHGHIMMDTLPLDLDGILSELSKDNQKTDNPFPNGARIGHMHLRVTSLERSLEFYHKKLGLDISADWSSMGAIFVSAGGYHHHIGFNIWHSLGGKPHVSGEAGLDAFTIEVPFNELLVKQFELQLKGYIVTKVGERELLVADPDGIRMIIKFVQKI